MPGSQDGQACNHAFKNYMQSPEYEKRSVAEYVELESDEKVKHVEKISSERIFGEKHDIWDVHTNKNRWWVVTNPTNLYLQKEFRSMDYVISFHVGLMTRMSASQRLKAKNPILSKLQTPWRKWEQAATFFNDADEAEEFQSVGQMCRSTLLTLIKTIASEKMVPKGETPPKNGDFINWSIFIANYLVPGSSKEKIRSYLKDNSKLTWELVVRLVHKENAIKADAEFILNATEHLLSIFSEVIVQSNVKAPEKCPKCSSYRLTYDYRSDIDSSFILCEACGWEKKEEK